MSAQNKILTLSFPAAEDLSNDQYRFVVMTAAGAVRRPDSETEVAIGILQNAPLAGFEAEVMLIGQSQFHANDALGIGTFVMPEYVSAADAGKGKDAAGALAYARGIVVEATGAEDDLGSVLLLGMTPGINDAVKKILTATTDATAGANTWSAAEMIGGLLLRDPNGADRADVTATAELIVAGIAGAIIGSSFEFTIKNTADGDEVITLTAGVGVTLVGTMTIRRGYAHRFVAVCTNVTAGQEAVSIYRLDELPATVDRQYSAAIADPGHEGAISVKQSGVCSLTTAAAETRTLAAPTFIGQEICLICDTYAVGDAVVTVATLINQTGNNTLTFGAVKDMCVLKAMTVGGALTWRIVANDGVALSTV